jgi:hypothetical protein
MQIIGTPFTKEMQQTLFATTIIPNVIPKVSTENHQPHSCKW